MQNDHPIIDLDRHVMEPMDMWKKYMPSRWHDDVPHLMSLERPEESWSDRFERLQDYALLKAPPAVGLRGTPIWKNVPDGSYIQLGIYADERRRELLQAETAAGQIESMDESNVDQAVLVPTYGGYLVFNEEIDGELSRVFAHAYNRWIQDVCSENPARLMGSALISKHEPEKMVADLKEAVTSEVCSVVLRPNPVLGRTLGHPDFRPFWAACSEMNVPILLHEGAHTRASTAGAERFHSHVGQHACSHPMEAMMAFLALLEGGVFEDFPNLHFAFLEAGCGFMPYWLWRLDHVEYREMRHELRKQVRMLPSEYFARQCWIAFEPGEAMLPQVVESLGEDRFIFGTDFPHVDHDLDLVNQLFVPPSEGKTTLSKSFLKKALWGNACTLLGKNEG